MLYPLLISAGGATLLFLSLSLMAMRNEILRRRIRALRLVAAASPVGAAA
jgi:heme exporter protein C